MQAKDPSTVNFDDQDWDLEEGSNRPPADATGVWKVAAGVAIGIVIGGALMWAVDRHDIWQEARPAQVEREPVRPAAEVTAGSAPVEPLRLPVEPTAAGAPAPQSAPPAAGEAPQSVVRGPAPPTWNAETDAASALRAAGRAAERKERAWALFYKKLAACDDSPPKASLVECANHFIRARREFERLYAAGKPTPPRQAVSASRSASGA